MATFFGEVVPAYSRAVEEGEDDSEEEENEEDREIRNEIQKKREVHVHWNPEITNSIDTSSAKAFQCSDLILAAGPNAAGFLSAFVLSSGSWETVGSVTLWNERCKTTANQQLPAGPSCVFHRPTDKPDVLICQCTCHVAEDQLFQWAEKVLGSIQKTGLTVTVLSDCSVAEYKTPDSVSTIPVPFLRALKTRHYKEAPHCPLLEQPNVITGLPAAVLSHCQVFGIPAVLYQCYSDVVKPDSVTMEAYKPTVSCRSLSRVMKLDSSESVDILKKLVRVNEAQSNLYT